MTPAVLTFDDVTTQPIDMTKLFAEQETARD